MLDTAARGLLLIDLVRGLGLTLAALVRPKAARADPNVMAPQAPGVRGEPALRRDAVGVERCIACKLCEAVCPALAITLESAVDDRRRATRFDLDLSRCVFCGLCQEACPVAAIALGPNIEVATESREELCYARDRLLATGDHREPAIGAGFGPTAVRGALRPHPPQGRTPLPPT